MPGVAGAKKSRKETLIIFENCMLEHAFRTFLVVKCEKIIFMKILIFVNFFPTVQIFKSGERISNYFMIFSQFFFKTQKYRSREDFMTILGEVFFRHHTKAGFSEVFLTSAYAISPT